MFELTEEQILIRDSAARFLEEAMPFKRRQEIAGSNDGFDPELWQSFAEMGWLGLLVSESAGGLDGSLVDAALIQQSMARQLVRSPWLQHGVTAATILSQVDAPLFLSEQLASGERIFTVGLFETDDIGDVQTTAIQSDHGFRINGCKRLVPWAAQADSILISVALDGETQIARVDASGPGITRRPYRLYDGSRAADVALDDISIPAEDMLGRLSEQGLQRIVDIETALLVSEAAEMMWAIHSQTLEYLKTREQFGQVLGSFQAIQHRLVDLYVDCELSRSMAEDAIVAVTQPDGAPDTAARVAAAKSWTGKTGRRVGKEGIHLHGGIGMTDDIPIGHYFKRLSAISRLNGNTDWQRHRFSRLNGVG